MIAILDRRMLTEDEAAVTSAELKANGKRIVFTNGCFDFIHPGHVHILRKALELGDVLFLGVNTDDSVSRLKGHDRPFLKLEARVQLLLELRSVNFVVPFDEDTPLKLIERIIPDVLVKGGDYTPDSVVGADFVKSHGGRVEIIPLMKGFSSTAIIKALDRQNKQ
ncbi:MAG: D-glycero-beta-D-manno-heptose 1-phosphate adenylyltransferase [Candidatus Fermentibacteraceae bacterium]|nr:D-glycero-beta-D-manno-heptose 1-phosphate adenylyltransferase [Candidatus Fermentibacteraceae bacterium]